ncbi:MAG: hypothetical protein JW788_03790 [Candidatus Omnitrophica bacterium]|nr:hypothetical protein [Candidatus Omnitrophota bacterium]
MAGKILFILAFVIFFMTNTGVFAAGQGEALSSFASSLSGAQVDWMWGEVVSIDKMKKELYVKYLDYDKDQEGEAVIAVNDETLYENIKSFDDINTTDTVTVDYVLSQGKYLAKVIGVENLEEEESPLKESSSPSVFFSD